MHRQASKLALMQIQSILRQAQSILRSNLAYKRQSEDKLYNAAECILRVSVYRDVLPFVTGKETKEMEQTSPVSLLSDIMTAAAASKAHLSFHLDAVRFGLEVVNFLLLPPNLVSQLLLLVCECVHLTVQPPINCRSGRVCISAEATYTSWLTFP